MSGQFWTTHWKYGFPSEMGTQAWPTIKSIRKTPQLPKPTTSWCTIVHLNRWFKSPQHKSNILVWRFVFYSVTRKTLVFLLIILHVVKGFFKSRTIYEIYLVSIKANNFNLINKKSNIYTIFKLATLYIK